MMNTQIKLSFMRYVLIFSALTAILSASQLAYAEPIAKNKKSTEDYFAESYQCLKKNDKPCAQIAAANVPSQSPYSKLLVGIFASLEGDFDTTFRELLPLQTNKTLNQPANVSLHTSLALAYENQSDSLRALEQRVIADVLLHQSNPINQEDININQHQIWEIVSVLSKTNLAEMRGNSPDSIIQGWLDLALAAKYQDNGESNAQTIERWRKAYADHPAKEGIAAQLFPASAVKLEVRKAKLKGAVALLLPFSKTELYPIADAIERGFTAAKKIAQDNADVKIYASQANAESTLNLYRQALKEGAKYIIGPLTTAETNAISNLQNQAITLMLNKTKNKTAQQYIYGLFARDEVQQIIKSTQNLGMKKACVISSNTEFNQLITNTFNEEWLAIGGQVSTINTASDAKSIEVQLNENLCDMIFLAAEAESARKFRALLPSNMPTFGTSEVYTGIAFNADDAALKGVRFVDIPWIVDRDNPKFNAYKQAATDLPAGQMQRWFALGADAYQMLIALDRLTSVGAAIDGLSGKIEINAAGEISRSLANASFGAEGVVLESAQ
jgi:outer membrane PBP1 activator LpoA protein